MHCLLPHLQLFIDFIFFFRSRDAIQVDKILEKMQEMGGQNVKLLDSNEMWEDPEFRNRFVILFELVWFQSFPTTGTPSYSCSFVRFSQEFQAKGAPARTMLFTTEDLLNQLALASKWSVDGTHRVAPQHFSQLFITMMKVNEKWVPAVHGLLPDHEKNSYRLQFEMIKYAMNKRALQNNIKSIMSDFELGIQTAAQEAFPGVEIRGCRFHYGQA